LTAGPVVAASVLLNPPPPVAAGDLDHVTTYRWVQRFTALLVDAPGSTAGRSRFVHETYVKVNGVWRYVYRAVDQRGQVIDVLIQSAVTPSRLGGASSGRAAC
jgi:hypothetical protein